MAIPEQFSLRWNDFHSNLSQGFHALLEGEDLVDVTLAADGQYVHAHKLILSVCSPYFKELFKMNPCEHPIVILKDVALSELRQLLQFMYKGEVHVRQQELSGFLHTAELLQVKGLTAGRERSESPQPQPPKEDLLVNVKAERSNDSSTGDWAAGSEDMSIIEASVPTITPCFDEEATRSPLKRLLKNTPNKTNFNTKKKSRPVTDNSTHHENIEYASDGEPLLDYDSELYHSVLEMPDPTKDSILNIKQEGWNCKSGGVKCPSCNRFFANRYNLKVHIRDKHDTLEGTLQCDICQKRMRNPSCLRVHMYHHRKQAAYLAQQLSAQPHTDLQKHMLPNMNAGKWRREKSIAASAHLMADHDTSPNSAQKWRQDSLLPPSPMTRTEQEKKSNMTKWQADPPSPSSANEQDRKSNVTKWRADSPSPSSTNERDSPQMTVTEDENPPIAVDVDLAEGI